MDAVTKYICELFLFEDIVKDDLLEIKETILTEISSFSRGEMIFSPSDFKKKIGFVVNGRCEVRRKKADGSYAVFNVLNPGDSFGVLSVFSDNKFPTEIFAAKASDVLFISKADIIKLIKRYPQISMNLMKFMANRIEYLNDKISMVSETKVEDRLFSYLRLEAIKTNSKMLTFNCKKCSEEINAGRASVYRAIEALTKSAIIKYEKQKITILKENL